MILPQLIKTFIYFSLAVIQLFSSFHVEWVTNPKVTHDFLRTKIQ